MGILEQRDLRASAFINAQVSEIYPSLIAAGLKAKWELVGHGWFQQSLKQAHDEADVINRSLDKLAELSGMAPRVWLGPGLGETDDTADLLKERGIEFSHDCCLDDLLFWIRTKHDPMVGLPHTFKLNDVPVYASKPTRPMKS